MGAKGRQEGYGSGKGHMWHPRDLNVLSVNLDGCQLAVQVPSSKGEPSFCEAVSGIRCTVGMQWEFPALSEVSLVGTAPIWSER